MDRLTKYWIGFNLVKGIGPVRLQGLLKHFGDIRSAWLAKTFQLQAAGLNSQLCDELNRIRRDICLDAVVENCVSQGIGILTWDHPQYPQRLRQISGSPFILYYKGELRDQDFWSVAVVGTRRVSSYGRQVAEEISRALALRGISVISGLARGVDGIAHRTALDSDGRTIAVLGSGLDQIYPPEHQGLAEQITCQGALISDYALGTPPEGFNFPPRNRIISGLAKLVAVIEAGKKSGALITAGYAAEQGRDVFAVPGRITSPLSKGTNLLLKQGAHPLLGPEDLFDALDLDLAVERQAVRTSLPGNSTEVVLFQAVGDEPLHVDEICARTDLPIEQVTATLAVMELKGMVRKIYGMKYVAIREMVVDYRIQDHPDAKEKRL